MSESPSGEPAISCSPAQFAELTAFVQPADLPSLAASYQAEPEKFKRYLTGHIVLSACGGQTPSQISRSLVDEGIFIHRDNISYLFLAWNNLGERDDLDIAIRLELVDELWCDRRPFKNPKDYWPFVTLTGGEDVFDIETARASHHRGDQSLYKTIDGRFVLIFTSHGDDSPRLARELSHQDATTWLTPQYLPLPEPLKPVPDPVGGPSQDPSSRLNPGWAPPPVEPSLLSRDADAVATPRDLQYSARDPARSSIAPESVENRALAIALRMIKSGEQPSITAIAKELGCQRTFLYKCPSFRAFIRVHTNMWKDLPRGRKDRETGTVEAWDRGD